MNGRIVEYSPFTLKVRNGKTWRWTQTWAHCTGKDKKNQETYQRRLPLPPPQTFRPLEGDAGSSPSRDAGFSSRQLTAERASSRSPLRRGAGEGGVLPTDPGSDPRPRRATPPGTTHRPRWKAPRPRVPPPILQGGYRGGGREVAATKQAAAGASQSLLRTSTPTHPVLRVIAQLDFLAQATGNLHGCSARGCPRSQRPVSSRRTGGRRGRDGKAGSPRDRAGTRCRRHALVLAAPTERRLGPAS